jgi:hypothetical protein
MNFEDQCLQARGSGIKSEFLEVKFLNDSLGVFALRSFQEGEAIEFCHAIVMEWRNHYVRDPALRMHAFWDGCSCAECERHGVRGMILLGNGSIYNGSKDLESANAAVQLHVRHEMAVVYAVKPIAVGEEVTVWFGSAYSQIWMGGAQR